MARPAALARLAAPLRQERSALVRRFCPRPETVLEDIVAALDATHGAPRGTSGMRVFLDGGQRYDLPDRVTATPRHAGESLDAWLRRVLGHQYCLTFNGIGSWSETFLRRVGREIVLPLRAMTDLTGGVDFYCFVGNYGRTPFGAHVDPDHTLLLHLGPAPKGMLVWPRDALLRQTGSAEPLFDFSDLRSARRVDMDPGDLLFIPAGVHHVAEAQQYSVSLGITVFPATLEHLVQQACDLYLRTTEDADGDDPASSLPRLAASLPALAALQGRLLETNAYVIHPPRRIAAPEGEPLRWRVAVPAGFPIGQGRTRNGRSEIFVRGRVVTIAANRRLRRVLASMNDGQAWDGREIARALAPDYGAAATRSLIRLLVELRGLDVLSRATSAAPSS